MLDNNGQPPVSLAAFVDCLKQFQEYPERFPLDLRAKFCECSEYSKQPSDDNLKELAHIAEELKDILQQRLTSQSRRARNQRTETNIIETIEYLVTHPERIPLVAVQKLRQVMDNLSLPQSTSRKVFRYQDSTSASDTLDDEGRTHRSSKRKRGNVSSQPTDQPIPLVVSRLCCPPGMIPLTAKVAKRLGINVSTVNQPSASR